MSRAPRTSRTSVGAAALALLASLVIAVPSTAAPPTSPPGAGHTVTSEGQLPAPPPPQRRKPIETVRSAETSAGSLAQALPEAALAAASAGGAPGASATRHTLVLYDVTGQWGWLGEAYSVMAGNLLSHGSAYTMHPVNSYQAGEMANYTGVVYIGSTYDEAVPTAFLDDVLAGSRPVIWMNHNIWQLTARAANFSGQYGWNWTQFDFSTTPTVTYKNVALQRDALAAPSGLLNTTVTDPTKATVLATAKRTDGTTLPWALRSGNLTYIGEIPFSYIGSTDRYFAAADLLVLLANPAQVNRKRALVRIEDVSPASDPGELRRVADLLFNQNVPFTVGLIPRYVDPNGSENGGVPEDITLAQAPAVVSALKYMQSRGGTLLMHGYTHQFSNVANPYNGVSGDDFEFYMSHIDSANFVIYDGPVPGDSAQWMQGRIDSSRAGFTAAGFAQPTIFEPPHYAASAIDYQVIHQNFGVRYDRGLYFSGWCPNGACGTGTPDYTRIYGQYFPFLVRDAYGSVVVPESLGNVEPVPFNNHPARLPADILASATGLTVVTDGVQSFFYHAYLGTRYLRDVVTGLKAKGYKFVSAAAVAAG